MLKKDKILVIEDDPSICVVLTHNLSDEGFEVECVGDGPDGLEKILSGGYSLIILDLNLPRLSGMSICKEVRKQNPTLPLIMLTSRDSEVDKVVGLEAGADDYISKPFSNFELMARVRARLRIATAATTKNQSNENGDTDTLRCGPLELHLEHRIVSVNGNQIDFTRKEFDVLSYFMQSNNRTITRMELLQEVWGTNIEAYEVAVTTLMGRLRRKLELADPSIQYIRIVRGVGFRFALPHELSVSTADEHCG